MLSAKPTEQVSKDDLLFLKLLIFLYMDIQVMDETQRHNQEQQGG